MAEEYARYQSHNDARYRKADALKEPDSNVISGLSGDALWIGAHLKCPAPKKTKPRKYLPEMIYKIPKGVEWGRRRWSAGDRARPLFLRMSVM